jgi:UDP-glucose 4-epimerase
MTQQRVLVTGGAGFIGSHVADAFQAAGYHVTVLDSLVRGSRGNVPSGAELVVADIREPAAAELVRDGGFDVVSHHAAQIDVRLSVQDPRADASVNVDGLLNVADAAARAGVRRFLFASSAGIYAEAGGEPIAEPHAKSPVSPYAVSKLAGEHYLFALRRTAGLDYVAMRYANVYGPRQDPHGEAGVVAIYCDQVAGNGPLTVFGDGDQTRDYLFVHDVAAANVLLAGAALADGAHPDERAFNVGTGRATSVNALARAVGAAAGREVALRNAPPRTGEIRHSRLDASRLAAHGWGPRVGIEQGLAATFAALSQASAAHPAGDADAHGFVRRPGG